MILLGFALFGWLLFDGLTAQTSQVQLTIFSFVFAEKAFPTDSWVIRVDFVAFEGSTTSRVEFFEELAALAAVALLRTALCEMEGHILRVITFFHGLRSVA